MGPSAKVIADSISSDGYRVTTAEWIIHRFTLAEANTHRVFSRNSASSRAIPLARQIERVSAEPAIPLEFPAEKPGMSGGELFEGEELEAAKRTWLAGRDSAVQVAKALGGIGVHKSIANRVLEPYQWHSVIVTSTSWNNFRGLRVNPGAQPEIRIAAGLLMDAIDASEPKELTPGQWHLPYIREDEYKALPIWDLIKISAARCARVSYLTHDGIRDTSKDLELYSKLASSWPMHASPMEHPCTPEPENVHRVYIKRHNMMDGVHRGSMDLTLPRYGNFIGWHQHRFDIEIAAQYQAFS